VARSRGVTSLADAGFGEYRNRVFRYYQEKRYGDALEAATEASKRFPEYDAKTAFWIACLRSRLGSHDEAIQTLQSATRRGLWWPAGTLEDSDLDPVRHRSEFKIVEEECRRLQRQAPKRAKPELMVRVPTGYSAGRDWPALLVFHGRYGERPEVSAEEWLPILSTGTILAVPWSSQVYGWDGRCWDDWELAEKDVKWSFSELSTKYSVDARKLVLGGFSQGAALSIYAVLKRLIPCCGFVAMAPSDWVRPEERRAAERSELSEPFASFVKASDCRGLTGAIIIGDQDPFFPKIKQLYALMIERGLDGKFLVEPGVGHEYPQGFGIRLRDAVNFVLTGT
jgi:hypothetical protein